MKCPECLRNYTVTKKGVLRAHGGHGDPGRVYCPGSNTVKAKVKPVVKKKVGRPKAPVMKFKVIVQAPQVITKQFTTIRLAYPYFEECVGSATEKVESISLMDQHEVLAYVERQSKSVLVPVI